MIDYSPYAVSITLVAMSDAQVSLLDLYLLILIESGSATSYSMQQHGGISLGASIPALRRMLDAGLVLKSKPGKRGRRDFSLTSDGIRAMKSWRVTVDTFLKGSVRDSENVCRAVSVCLAHKDRKLAAFILRHASGEQKSINRERFLWSPGDSAAGFYVQLRRHLEKARIEAERTQLLKLSKELSHTPK